MSVVSSFNTAHGFTARAAKADGAVFTDTGSILKSPFDSDSKRLTVFLML